MKLTKRVLQFALVAGFLVGALGIGAGSANAYAPQELIKNGGFELGNNGDWAGDTARIGTWSPTVWHGGAQGVKMLQNFCPNPLDCVHTWSVSQVVDLPAHATSLVFTAWYKHSYAPMSIKLVNADNPAEVWASYDLNATDVTPVWTQAGIDITAHKGHRIKVILQSQVWFDASWYSFFDDVSIIAELADITAPITAAVVAPAAPNGLNGWYTSAPTITLSATDDVGGTGVASISYAWDGGAVTAYASALTAPEGTHTLTYFATDVAGNVEATQSLALKVDSVAPTGTIGYSTTATTTENVVATLTPSEPVTVTNNGGLLTHAFTSNGSFTFTFQDAAGNMGSATATVNNIQAAPVSAAPVAVIVLPPTTPAPQGKVLGATTVKPVITALLSGKGKVQLIIDGKKKLVAPLGKKYTGLFFAQKYDFGEDGSFTVAIPKDPTVRGVVAVYNSKGVLVLKRKLGGVYSTRGLVATATVQGEKVYLAVGQKVGNRVEIFRVTGKTFKLMRSLMPLKKGATGTAAIKFVKPYKSGDAGLAIVAKAAKKTATKMFRFIGVKNNWMEDTKFNVAKVKLLGGKIVIAK
ncbi:MAG: chitobiase/beta-hexosaminidase C-terminal domain-containing protein [Candidatus Kerfeldbacteria bacterium]|nr:chitobiase/beta-hexosaminidase C-terminal domain-containing protein [Candidatus Kerfeldbacteria bacterium]